jgi:hypothetical protein
LEQLISQRDAMVRQAAALNGQIEGLNFAIALLSNSLPRHTVKVRVTETLLKILTEAGEAGLKASDIVAQAATGGTNLNKASVYTLLNRLTRLGSVVHRGGRYFIVR